MKEERKCQGDTGKKGQVRCGSEGGRKAGEGGMVKDNEWREIRKERIGERKGEKIKE